MYIYTFNTFTDKFNVVYYIKLKIKPCLLGVFPYIYIRSIQK